jgi:hypothetical protein
MLSSLLLIFLLNEIPNNLSLGLDCHFLALANFGDDVLEIVLSDDRTLARTLGLGLELGAKIVHIDGAVLDVRT